ncbi:MULTISPECIES: hypothetical protein [unclassified Halobacteriovorax]|uniref:hypothetical protein n=1 Tax=unclassified Halobacteriovorax TaxID=2639665 RepID=UPI00399A3D95
MLTIKKYTLQAGDSVVIPVSGGNFIRGLGAPSRYHIQIDDDAATPFETGIAYQHKKPFENVRLINTAEEEQEIEVAISDGWIDDNRLVGRMDLNGAIGILATAANGVTVHPVQSISAATEVLPLNLVRRSAVIQCNAPVYIGNAVDGIEVQQFTWDAQAALTLVPKTGTVKVKILEETN